MKAAVVKGKRRIEVEEVPTPTVQPGTLLLKTIYCAICGSDLEYVDDHFWHNPVRAGAILGHEYVAKVVAVGDGVEGWSVGDRATFFKTSCGQCYWCRRGLHHLCMGGPSRGIPLEDGSYHFQKWHGAMAEYIRRPPSVLVKVPDSISDEEAALTEPLATGATAVLSSGIKIGDSAIILGAGHIGLLTMLCARAAGAAPIIVTEKIKSRLDKALELGADKVLNPDEVDVVSEAVKLTEVGPDIAFVCVRAAGVVKEAFDMVRREGRVILVGFPASAELDSWPWVLKEVRVEGAVHMGELAFPALKLLEYKRVNAKPIITEIIPLEEAQRAFDSLYSKENVAILLKP